MSEFLPRTPITEAAIRPDGNIIQLINGDLKDQFIVAGAGAVYSKQDVEKIGLGSFVIGLAKLGKAYTECPTEQLAAGKTKLFADLI